MEPTNRGPATRDLNFESRGRFAAFDRLPAVIGYPRRVGLPVRRDPYAVWMTLSPVASRTGLLLLSFAALPLYAARVLGANPVPIRGKRS